MICSEIETYISAYADDELPQDTKETVRKHIESCKACSILLKFEIAAKSSINLISKVKAPLKLRKNILAEISGDSEKESAKASYIWSLFKQNIAFATAASVAIFIGVLFVVIYLYSGNKMSPFIGSVYAYHVENNVPLDIKGTTEEIEKVLAKSLDRDIPIPTLDGINLSFCGASNHTDVEGWHCAALRYKGKDGREVSHFVICCMKVPIDKLPQIKGRPDFHYASKNGLNIIFWRCPTTRTTRCLASTCSLDELMGVVDEFFEKATEHYKTEHLKAN